MPPSYAANRHADDALRDANLLRQCALPLTGKRCVAAICTDHAWIDVTQDGLVLRELAPGISVEAVQRLTEPKLIVAPDVKTMAF